jgi:hypothetical protein
MVRYTTFFAIVILVVSIFGLFQVKFYVQDLSKDIIELGRQLKQEKESLHILKAEWTYLNQPERLRQLAGKYLQLDNIKLSQMHKMDGDLPLYLAEDEVKRELYLASYELSKTINKNSSYINQRDRGLTSNVKSTVKNIPELTKVKY